MVPLPAQDVRDARRSHSGGGGWVRGKGLKQAQPCSFRRSQEVSESARRTTAADGVTMPQTSGRFTRRAMRVAGPDCGSPEIQCSRCLPAGTEVDSGMCKDAAVSPLTPARTGPPYTRCGARTPVGVFYEIWLASRPCSGVSGLVVMVDPGRYRGLASGPELSEQATGVRRPSSWCQPRGAPFPRFRGVRGLCSARSCGARSHYIIALDMLPYST